MKKYNNLLAYPTLMGVGLSKNKNRVLSFVNQSGEIKLHTKKSKSEINTKIPFIRGILIFFYGIYEFLWFLSISSRFGEVEKQEFKIEKKISTKLNIKSSSIFWTIFALLTIFFGFFAFNILPDLVAYALPQNTLDFHRNLLVAFMKASIFYITLVCLKFIPEIKSLYRFNGAINSYLNQLQDNNNSNINITQSKQISWYRTTNFLTFVIFSFILHFFVVSLIGFQVNFALEILFNILIFVAETGLYYEILKLFQNRKFLICRVMAIILGWIVANKPTRTELETCIGGFEELQQMAKDKERIMLNGNDEDFATSAVLCEVKSALAKNDITDTAEAEWLIATVLSTNRTQIKLIPKITSSQLQEIRNALALRLQHMPLSKIFGWTEFYGYKFEVDKNVLSPRPETEILCEETIKIIKKYKMSRCLDLCTGSGAIAVTIALNTNTIVHACDISKSALKIAQKNAKNNNAKIKFFESNMFSDLKKDYKFDIIVSNPPYIKSKEIALLDEEVKNYDPHIALDGGEDGFDFIKCIANNAPKYLKKDGFVALEIGEGQAPLTKKILSENFKNIKIIKDYSNIDRIVIGQLKGVNNDRKDPKDKREI